VLLHSLSLAIAKLKEGVFIGAKWKMDLLRNNKISSL
jgi:hypothetical protein